MPKTNKSHPFTTGQKEAFNVKVLTDYTYS